MKLTLTKSDLRQFTKALEESHAGQMTIQLIDGRLTYKLEKES